MSGNLHSTLHSPKLKGGPGEKETSFLIMELLDSFENTIYATESDISFYSDKLIKRFKSLHFKVFYFYFTGAGLIHNGNI